MAKRAKVLAVANDMTMADLFERLVSPKLDDMEREHVARYRHSQAPTRTPAK
jgi:hypothetical protein